MTRLIDADALKENINKFIGYLDEDMISRIKVVIDNAPTVAYPFEKFRTMFCGTCQANMRIEPERPKGEWGIGYWTKEKTDKTHYIYTCSVCGARSRFTKAPYCYKCGSRMIEG